MSHIICRKCSSYMQIFLCFRSTTYSTLHQGDPPCYTTFVSELHPTLPYIKGIPPVIQPLFQSYNLLYPTSRGSPLSYNLCFRATTYYTLHQGNSPCYTTFVSELHPTLPYIKGSPLLYNLCFRATPYSTLHQGDPPCYTTFVSELHPTLPYTKGFPPVIQPR